MKLERVGIFIVEVAEPIKKNKNYIDFVDLAQDRRFWAKVYDIESDPDYSEKCVYLLKSVLEFLDYWQYISWNQYNMIMRMYPTPPPLPTPSDNCGGIGSTPGKDWDDGGRIRYPSTVARLIGGYLDSKHPDEAAEYAIQTDRYLPDPNIKLEDYI